MFNSGVSCNDEMLLQRSLSKLDQIIIRKGASPITTIPWMPQILSTRRLYHEPFWLHHFRLQLTSPVPLLLRLWLHIFSNAKQNSKRETQIISTLFQWNQFGKHVSNAILYKRWLGQYKNGQNYITDDRSRDLVLESRPTPYNTTV